MSKLGSLEVGSIGDKQFEDFYLTWKVYLDHVEWKLSKNNTDILSGGLKYSGWNRIEILNHSKKKEFINHNGKLELVDLHQWPMIKEAFDFIYYDLFMKISEE